MVMIDQLVQVCCPSGSSPELLDPVECSNWEVLKLRTEVQRLQRENLELRQQVGYWQSRHRDSLKRIAALEQEIEQLKGEKRQLQADLFGRRSETKPLNDRSNHLDDPQDDSQQPKRKRGQQPENHGPQRRDYSGLPVRETFVNLPPSNVSARIAVNRYVAEVIPKIPSKSRSTCVPTADDCDGGGTSGLAPARGDAPSLPHLLPSSFPRGGTAFRSGSKSSWTSISPIGPPSAC